MLEKYKAPGGSWANISDLPDNHDNITFNLLLNANNGIGLMAGYYDETLSVQYVSEVALSIMGYPSIEDFDSATSLSLLNLLQTKLGRDKLQHFIENGLANLNHVILKGYNGKLVPVKAVTTTVLSRSGKRMWYGSISQNEEIVVDSLTGTSNREGFILRAEQIRADGLDLTDYALIYLNIDNFKAVNALYTTAGGDDLLCNICRQLKQSNLDPLLIGRIESDHFVFLAKKSLVDTYDFYQLQNILWDYSEKQLNIRARCGIYYIDDSEMEISTMIDNAKLAKKRIDDKYIKPYSIYDSSMSISYMLQAGIRLGYLKAIENKEFQVYYQPVVDTMTGQIVSAEALIRWHHPEKGLISPAVFIQTLEDNGAINKVDEYVNRTVYEFLLQRYLNNQFFVPISVNLSWMDFYCDELIDSIIETATNGSLPEDSIRYEMTETSYSTLQIEGKKTLARLNEHGIKVLLDDFGSGTSSFSMIKNYDFDILKLDMSFTKQIETNSKVKSIIKGMVNMCHDMNIQVVAEGTETDEQVRFLQQTGCDYIQGYYFSKPLSQDDFIAYLDKNKKAK